MSFYEVDKGLIQDLLGKPLLRTLMEILKMIKDGRPFPPLPNFKSVYKDWKDAYTRNI
jgi:hypothetical protein